MSYACILVNLPSVHMLWHILSHPISWENKKWNKIKRKKAATKSDIIKFINKQKRRRENEENEKRGKIYVIWKGISNNNKFSWFSNGCHYLNVYIAEWLTCLLTRSNILHTSGDPFAREGGKLYFSGRGSNILSVMEEGGGVNWA